MTATVRHPQFILAIENRFFTERPTTFKQGICQYPFEQFIDEASPYLVMMQRASLETNPKYRQLLPYLIVRQTADNGEVNYVAYQRIQGGGEARLLGNASIGFGGHVDLGDVQLRGASVVDLAKTLWMAALREFMEELEITDQSGEIPMGYKPGFVERGEHFILDDTNEVGKVHVGLIYVIDIPAAFKARCKEAELKTLKPQTAGEFLVSDLPWENWSKIYLDYLADQQRAALYHAKPNKEQDAPSN